VRRGVTLLDGPLAERALGVVVGVRGVHHAAGGRRVGARQGILADDDGAACCQSADRHDEQSADDAAHGAMPVSRSRRRVRPELVERRHRLVDLHRRDHGVDVAAAETAFSVNALPEEKQPTPDLDHSASEITYRVWPKKVSHYRESSLNRIKNCQLD